MRGYRKIIVFLISLILVGFLSWHDKETTSITTLFTIYCGANVGAKFSKKDV